jgi:hypothetical protein
MELNDIIDLGNRVFDRLIEAHGEIEESRMLFLYGITTATRWDVNGKDLWVLVQQDGVFSNFNDPVITGLSNRWQVIRQNRTKAEVENRLKRFREEYERPAPKDGEVFNFWQGGETFREIRL